MIWERQNQILLKKSGDVKPPKVEVKPNIDGTSVHVEASLYFDFGVLPLHANEVDTVSFFSEDVKWKDRDDLLNWVRVKQIRRDLQLLYRDQV